MKNFTKKRAKILEVGLQSSRSPAKGRQSLSVPPGSNPRLVNPHSVPSPQYGGC